MRGALSNPTGRFERVQREAFDDGWNDHDSATPAPLPTRVTDEFCKSIISSNQSPDLLFERSINPYRGCEHGCVYCFARPTHSYLGLSAGLDFETKLYAKGNAAAVLAEALSKPNYTALPIALGANTDPYQPIEREHGLTRQLLTVLWEHRHPVYIITKSNLVLRDVDILEPMAQNNLVQVLMSVTTLDRTLARAMEPRAPTPQRRLDAVQALASAGVPTGVLCAPMIPALNDVEMERLLEAASAAGARSAGYALLRLPHEIKTLFTEWLETHYPERATHVLNNLRDMRDGALYNSQFGTRMRGTGAYADMLAQRFKLACRRLGFNHERMNLTTTLFCVPPQRGQQLQLF